MSSPLARFRQALASAIASRQGLCSDVAQQIERQIRRPKQGQGDLALGCFEIAKAMDIKNPAEAAKIVAEGLADDDNWATVEAVGPYVNVSYATKLLAETVVPAARAATYGENDQGAGKTVVIDFSSPNIAKPLAYHHLRSTVIGAAIQNLHKANGWTVAGINYLGDWGKQFGLLATGFQRYGDPSKRANAKHLIEVYVKANKDAEVGKTKAAIAAPETARGFIRDLQTAHAKLTAESEADLKTQKKVAKQVKGLQKKLRTLRSLKDSNADPLEGCDTWLDELEATAKAAQERLPKVLERDQEAREFFKKMENKDEAAVAEWQEFRTTSIAEFERVYERMGIEFASLEGESLYQDILDETVEAVRKKPGTSIDQGAEIVDMPTDKGDPPALIKTRDGTTLYITRDIAAARDRYERFSFERSLYVVAADQSLHFKQLFRTLEHMGHEWSGTCEHVPFGRVHGMSTRQGKVVFLDEVLDEACAKARSICSESNKIAPENLEEAVEAIGVGAIMFGDLRNLRTSDYNFDWAQVLDFSGHTAPYVQFSHARTCSILRKGGGVPETADYGLLTLAEERTLIVALGSYPEAVAEACEAYEPSIVTRALLDIAQCTASYLTAGNRERSQRVLVEDNDAVRAARLHLVDAVRHCLKHGLALLNCRAPESM